MGSYDTRRGFTLVELMVTLAVAAILITVAIPNFANIIRENRLVTFTNSLVGSLVLARSEAVRRGLPVSACASDNGTQCTSTPWRDGWIVYTDQGTAGSVDGTDTVLRVEQEPGASVTEAGGTPGFVRYAATGFLAACAEGCGGMTVAAVPGEDTLARSLLGDVVTALVPGRAAYAAPGNNNGGGNGGGNTDNEPSSSGGDSTNPQFTFCHSGSLSTVRTVSVAPSGRVTTTASGSCS